MTVTEFLQAAIDAADSSLTLLELSATLMSGMTVTVLASDPSSAKKCPSNAQKSWLHNLLTTADSSYHIVSITVEITSGYSLFESLATPPALPPTPPPFPPAPPPTLPTITRIVQANDVYAYNPSSGDLTITDKAVSQGGLVQYTVSGGHLSLVNCYSEGAPAGSGKYFAIVATNPAANFTWDNTDIPDHWITNGNESGGRVMGACVDMTITNVDFVNRLHKIGDSTGSALAPIASLSPLSQPPLPRGWTGMTEWKQVLQLRDIAGTAVLQGTLPCASRPNGQGRIVGILDIGAQADPLDPQFVNDLTIHQYGLQKLPHFTDMSTIGIVRMRSCFKVDINGRAIVGTDGNIVMWPDRDWP